MSTNKLVEALEAAKNGLQWYRDAYPEANSGADDEMVQQIDDALASARHSGDCLIDPYARDVCEGMYAEKCDDVIGLCEALNAVLSLAGESAEVRNIVETAIREHGHLGV